MNTTDMRKLNILSERYLQMSLSMGTQYYQREVKPHLPGSWMDCSKDKTGYEINFTKYFYKYKPLRSVEEITKDLLALEKESEGLMRGLMDL